MHQLIWNAYKPLRNHLKKVSLIESLGVIRAYLQYFQFTTALPGDIEIPPEFRFARNRVETGIWEWELEVLAKEIIINSPESPASPKTFKRWNYLAFAINKLRNLENEIAGLYPHGSGLLELYRIAHRQFPWQLRPNGIWLTRYFKLFCHPRLDSIIQRVIGLTTRELYLVGLALTGVYMESLVLYYPPNIQIREIDRSKLDKLLAHFSCDLASMKTALINAQRFDEKYAYAFNPMRAYPLIRMVVNGRESLIAPIPAFLFRRFTEGVFYEVCRESQFGESFGESFQAYVGEVIKRGIARPEVVVFPEEEYHVGKERKDTTDWIVDDARAALFVECKTKRLRIEARVELIDTTVLESELDKMADFIVQNYKAIRDARAGYYPHYRPDQDKRIFPIILVLEEWFVFGGRIYDQLGPLILRKFTEASLDTSWIEEIPYSICSIEEFEWLVQVVNFVGVDEVMNNKLFNEKRTWMMMSYIMDQYHSELTRAGAIFPDELDSIFPAGLS